MALASGTRLGAYEVVSLLGEGGMGEVYRARDTKLNRDVALKILPEGFSLDGDRIARFRREAHVLAALNHPNIAHIYGFEDSGSTHALVLELVEGPTLADRIAKGPIPLDEALPIAKQIAEALEAAHEQGIVHRDLKPANIKVRDDGMVKVLDFGLAKALEQQAPAISPVLTASPTITTPAQMTGVGTILGTAAYMSPEQASGKPVDKRSDLWAFGVVLLEMLTGRPVFEGETVSHVLASVLKDVPDWAALPPDTPTPIRRLLARCLEKDRKKRLDSGAIARLEVDEALANPSGSIAGPIPLTPPSPLWKRAVPPALAAVGAAALVGAIAWWMPRSSIAPAVTRFSLNLPGGTAFLSAGSVVIAISPDGSRLAYAAVDGRLYSRAMSEADQRPISGTELGAGSPVFSPDGQSIAFVSTQDGTLKRIRVSGGAAVTICPAQLPIGMSWDANGILFTQTDRIMRVSPNGGTPEPIVSLRPNELAYGAQMLPDGRTVLFSVSSGAVGTVGRIDWDKAEIVTQSISTGTRKTLVQGGSNARYVPTGHIVYAVGGELFAVPFDARRLEVTGGAIPVVEGVRRSATGVAHFSVSDTGSLVYVPGPASERSSQFALASLAGGTVELLKLPPGPYRTPRISPDGTRLAVGSQEGKDANIWIYDLSGTSSIRRLTFGGNNQFPIWSADGQRVVFQSDREGDLGIYWQPADGSGTAERLTKAEPGISHVPESWSHKGDRFSFSAVRNQRTDASLWTYSIKDRRATLFSRDLQSSAVLNSSFSPDGRWIAYTLRAKEIHIIVEPFPATGAQYQISKGNGHHSLWSPDGKTLFYVPGNSPLVAVNVSTQPTFTFGEPTPVAGGLNTNNGETRGYDVAPDGKRFIFTTRDSQFDSLSNIPQIQVVLNWFEELKQRVPVK